MSNKQSDHQKDVAAVTKLIGGNTPYHIAQVAAQAAERGLKLLLTLPADTTRLSTQRLFHRDGPVGQIVGSHTPGADSITYNKIAFDPMEVIAFLHAEGLIKVVEKQGEKL